MALNMVDVSAYQAGIGQEVFAQVDVVAVKVSEGTSYVNPSWRDQATAGLNVGKPVGLYHFAREGDSDAQVNYFLDQCADMIGQDVWPILDFEADEVVAYEAFARDWLAVAQQRTGMVPWLYTGASRIAAFGYNSLRSWPLWVSGYPYSSSQGLGALVGFDWVAGQAGGLGDWNVAGWQYTENGCLPGWGGALDFSEVYVTDPSVEAGSAPATVSDPAAMEAAIGWFTDREGQVTYSMDYRNGPSSYDCSSSVYYALAAAGINTSGTVGNTETMFNDLPSWGFVEIAKDGNGDIPFQRGDIFVWGVPGDSAGAGGHTGIFVDEATIIHCNFGYDSITVNDYNTIWTANRRMFETGYRYTGGSPASPVVQQATNTKDWFDMATQKDLEVALDTVIHRNDGFFRQKVHEVLHGEKFNRQGTINGKPVGGATTIATEAAWSAANIGGVKADVLYAQKQIADQAKQITQQGQQIQQLTRQVQALQEGK